MKLPYSAIFKNWCNFYELGAARISTPSDTTKWLAIWYNNSG
jgi:hypothetical protein